MLQLRLAGVLGLLLLTSCTCGRANAQSAEPTLLGRFNDWAAYTYKAPDTKVCYISSRPKAMEPKTAKRDPAFLLVTHMPGRKVRGEVMTIIGYAFKKDSTVELKVDDAAFELFSNADGAWADTTATEKKIVDAMRNGKALLLKGTSWRGTETLDTYSLEGVSAALAKIDEACK
ncbi:MAG: invasion associated locus B family protein [Aestuariivirga sp.]